VLALHLEELGEHFSEIRMVYWEANEPQNPFIFSSTPDTLIRDKATILSLMQQIASLNLAEFVKHRIYSLVDFAVIVLIAIGAFCQLTMTIHRSSISRNIY